VDFPGVGIIFVQAEEESTGHDSTTILVLSHRSMKTAGVSEINCSRPDPSLNREISASIGGNERLIDCALP
jgi:hypothetical protein